MKRPLKCLQPFDEARFSQDDMRHESFACFPLRPSRRIRGRNSFQNPDDTIRMKTHSFPAIALAVASTFALNSGALGHGGAGSGGGHCGGGGGGHFGGGGWHGGGRGHGCYGGYYGGWWGGDPGYAYDDWGYGYPDYSTSALYYPQQTYSTVSYSAQNSGSLVTEVQQRLARTQYYRGAVDGRAGPHTRSAIGQYQSDHYLPVTGRIDKPLLQSLGLL